MVGGGVGMGGLVIFVEVFGLVVEWMLVDVVGFGMGEWQVYVFEFEYGFGVDGIYVFDCVLVIDVVGVFDGVVYVLMLIVVWVG